MIIEPQDTFTEDILSVNNALSWCQKATTIDDPNPLWMNLWYEGEAACMFSDSNAGKSIYAVQIADSIASTGKRVLYFDFEQSAKQFQLRYTNERGNFYSFSHNFLRCEIDVTALSGNTQPVDLIDSVISAADRAKADILIIDNLTFMCADSENGLAAHDFMMKLIEYKKAWNLSILILAHTPKREYNSPITQNDLAGSKRLFNFFDSVFAIGRSTQGDDMRYIKQLKARMCPITMGENSVLSARIIKDNTMLRFEHLDQVAERAHLKTSSGPNSRVTDEQQREILDMRNEGKSIREIASIVGVSKSTVGQIVKNSKEETV